MSNVAKRGRDHEDEKEDERYRKRSKLEEKIPTFSERLQKEIIDGKLIIVEPKHVKSTKIMCRNCGNSLISNKLWTVNTVAGQSEITIAEINSPYSDFWKNLSLKDENKPIGRMGANRLNETKLSGVIDDFLGNYHSYVVIFRNKRYAVIKEAIISFTLPSRIMSVYFWWTIGFIFRCRNRDYYYFGEYGDRFCFWKLQPFRNEFEEFPLKRIVRYYETITEFRVLHTSEENYTDLIHDTQQNFTPKFPYVA